MGKKNKINGVVSIAGGAALILGSLVILVMTRNNGEDLEVSKEESVLNKISQLISEENVELEKRLGEPKDVYKESVYTYTDELGKYDVLLNDEIESVVWSTKGVIGEKKVFEILNLGENITYDEVLKEAKKYIDINLKDESLYDRVSIVKDENSDLVKTVKIYYK